MSKELERFIKKHDKEILELEEEYGGYCLALAVTILRKLNGFPKPSDKYLDEESKSWRIYNLVKEIQYPLIDHCRTHKDGLIVEPYNFTIDSAEKLVKICRENDLDFYVNGASYHYPGRCLRVFISPSQDETKSRTTVESKGERIDE